MLSRQQLERQVPSNLNHLALFSAVCITAPHQATSSNHILLLAPSDPHRHEFNWLYVGDDQVVIGRKTTGPRVVRDQASVNAARRAGESIEAAKKSVINAAHVGPDHQRIAKLDRVNEVAPPAKIKPSVAQAMKDARIALSMTQKDLAAKTNEKPTVIGDYEAARAIPSPQILAKFERILKVKLRGKDIGAPLAPPAKKT
ncbi:transcription factor [Puccinia sorghi]|uniref:Transcription factor n=1 Tax=Puccinia sorghi TaxID=27349 RepID=A0A0L6UZ40_9BASI|nr:transcription factor [Puccinia sorghi]